MTGWTKVERKHVTTAPNLQPDSTNLTNLNTKPPPTANELLQSKTNVFVKQQSHNQYASLVDFTNDEEYIKLRNVELLALFSKTEIYKRTNDWIDTCTVNLSDKYQDKILQNLHQNATKADSKSLEQMKIFTDFTELLIRLVPFINVNMLNAIFSSLWIGTVIESFSECIKQEPSAIAYQVESMESHMQHWRKSNEKALPADRENKYREITSSLFEEVAKTGDTDVESTPAPTTVDANLQKINLSNQLIEAIFWYMCSRITIKNDYDFRTDTFIIEGKGILDELKKTPVEVDDKGPIVTPHDTNEFEKMVFKFMSKIITEMIKNEINEIELESKTGAESKQNGTVRRTANFIGSVGAAVGSVVGSVSRAVVKKITGPARFNRLGESLSKIRMIGKEIKDDIQYDGIIIPIIDTARGKICQLLSNTHCDKLFGQLSDGKSFGAAASISSKTLKHICDKKNETLEDGRDIDKFFKLHTELFGDLQIGTSDLDVTKIRRRLHDMAIKPNSPDTVIDRIVGFIETAPFKAIIFACLSYNDASSGDSDSDSLINVLNSDFTKQLESNSDISLNVRVMSVIAHNTDIPFIVPFRNALAVYTNKKPRKPSEFMFCNPVTVDKIERELIRIGLFDDMNRQIEGATRIPPPASSGGGRRGCDISRRKKIMRKIRTYTKKWKGTGGFVGEALSIFQYIINTYILTFKANVVFAIVSSIGVYLTRNTRSDILIWIRDYIGKILVLITCVVMLIKAGMYFTGDNVVGNFIEGNHDRAEAVAIGVFGQQLVASLAGLAPAMRSTYLDILSEQINRMMHKGTAPISTPKSGDSANKQLLENANTVLKNTLEAAKGQELKDASTIAELRSVTTPIGQFDALQHNRFGQKFLRQSPIQVNDLNGANEYVTLFAKGKNLIDSDLETERKFDDEGGKLVHALFVFANFEDIHPARVENTQEFTDALFKIIDPWITTLRKQVHTFVTDHKFSSDTTSVRMPFKDKTAMVEAAQAFVDKFSKLMTDKKGNIITGVSNSLLKLVTIKAKELFPANTAANLVKLFTDKTSLVDYYKNAPDVDIAQRDFVVLTQTVTRYLHDGGFSRDHKTLVAPHLLDSAVATEYACSAKIYDGSVFNVATMAMDVLTSSTELKSNLNEIMDNYLKSRVVEEGAEVVATGVDLIIALFPDPQTIAIGKATGQVARASAHLYNAVSLLKSKESATKIVAELGIILQDSKDYISLQANSVIIRNQCTAAGISSAIDHALRPTPDISMLALQLKDVGFDKHYDNILKKVAETVRTAQSEKLQLFELDSICKWVACIATVLGIGLVIKHSRKKIYWNGGLSWINIHHKDITYALHTASLPRNRIEEDDITYGIFSGGGSVIGLKPRYLSLGYKNNKNIPKKTRSGHLKTLRRKYYAKKTYKLRYNGNNHVIKRMKRYTKKQKNN